MAKYFKTQDQLAAHIGLSRQQLSKYLKRDDAPMPGKSGWNADKVARYVKDTKLSGLKGDGSLRDEKTLREIKMLDVKIEKETGTLVNASDARAEYTAKLGRYRAIIEGWADHSSAKYPALVDQIEELERELLGALANDRV